MFLHGVNTSTWGDDSRSFLKLQCSTFWVTWQFTELWVIDLSFSWKASLRSGRCSMCTISMPPVLKCFVHQLQTAENTIFLVIENRFHSGLDCTMIIYTLLVLSNFPHCTSSSLFNISWHTDLYNWLLITCTIISITLTHSKGVVIVVYYDSLSMCTITQVNHVASSSSVK
jgi:hypothetical protein